MALFKVLRGNEDNLPEQLTDGYAYFTSDTNNFYIDHPDENGELIRSLSGVGKNTSQGGEVFNDYETNEALGIFSHTEGLINTALTKVSHVEGYRSLAGKNAFHIEEIIVNNGSDVITLQNCEDIAYLEVGDLVSIALPHYGNLEAWKEVQDVATITAIDNNTITVSPNTGMLPEYLIDDIIRIERKLWINQKPTIGNHDFSGISHAEGCHTQSLGEASHTEGNETVVTGPYGHAEGSGCRVDSESGHAEGRVTVVEKTAGGGHAEGQSTRVSAHAAHAEGTDGVASGHSAHVEGTGSVASGQSSHAEGEGTAASGLDSHAEGKTTQSIGKYSHSEGEGTVAQGDWSHAEGRNTQANGVDSHAEGTSTQANGANAHAEGGATKAIGDNSHAEGNSTQATGSASHAEGTGTKATAREAHAEGVYSEATGNFSHAEGERTYAQGARSHSGGILSKAVGENSFAHGYKAYAHAANSVALGILSEADYSGQLLLNVGNGKVENGTDHRSSALKLDFDGNLTIQGGITANNIYTKAEIEKTYATKEELAKISVGEVEFATLAQTAETAVRAHGDEDGNNIKTTYATKSEVNSKLSSVYKYKGTGPWNMLYYGFILAGMTDQFEIGDVWNIDEDAILPAEYSEDGKEHTIIAGDNIAVVYKDSNGIPKFDKLAGTIDLSNYITTEEFEAKTSIQTITLSSSMTKQQIIDAIHTAKDGTNFNIISDLRLEDVNITFPKGSKIYTTSNRRPILYFGYSDLAMEDDNYWENSYDLNFSDGVDIDGVGFALNSSASSNVVGNFGKNCKINNVQFDSYAWGDWGKNCVYTNCIFYVFELFLSANNFYIKCHIGGTNDSYFPFEDKIYLSGCTGEIRIWSDAYDYNLEILEKIKTFNPDLYIYDEEDNEISGMYLTKDALADLDTGMRAATIDEIDAAIGDMATSYAQMLNLTNQIIDEQNELIGGEI